MAQNPYENGTPNGKGDAPLEEEIVAVCGAQRRNEPYPCTNSEPCPVHCGAKLRGERAGRKCPSYAMPNGRCRKHGGKSLKGIGHPNYKDGSHSRYRPKGIKDAYERALSEGTRTTENREELALITASIEQILEEMGEDSEDWFRLLNQRATAVEEARNYGDYAALTTTLNALLADIRRGSAKYQKRRELQQWIDLRGRTSERETRRLEKEHQMVTREHLLMVMDQLGDIIYEEVRDRNIRARIAERAAELTD